MHRFSLLLVLLIALLGPPSRATRAQDTATPDATSPPGSVSDWPGFRQNPARTGATSASGPVVQTDVRWRVETGGSGQNSPAVADGVVYTRSNANLLFALDAATGREIWRYEMKWSFSQPVVADGLVVVGGRDGLHAIDAASGQERWLYQPNNTPRLFDSSPTIADGVVYIGDGGEGGLFAIDLATGTERWQFDTHGGSFASPAIADGVAYIATDTVFGGANVGVPSQVYAVDVATGTERWHYGTGNPADTFFASPAVGDGVVYIGTQNANDDQTYLFAIDGATGQEQWRTPTARVFSSAAVADGMVVLGSDALYAYDAATGRQVWRLAIGEVDSSPSIANGIVYAESYEGFLVTADVTTGHELWHVPLDGGGFSSPAVADGMVYVSTDNGSLYALGEGQAATASPVPSDVSEIAFADAQGIRLLETTIAADQLPPAPTFAHAFVYSWPTGVGYQYQEDAPGIIVNCVVAGRWAYSPLPASSSSADAATPTADEQTTLETGDCVALPAGQHRTESNPGPDTLSLLRFSIVPEGFFVPANLPPEIVPENPILFIDSREMGALLEGEITLTLEQVQLAPGAVIDDYVGDGIGRIAAAYDLTNHLGRRIDGSVRNLGTDPMAVFLLTMSSPANTEVATPIPAISVPVEPEASPVASGASVTTIWQLTGGDEAFASPGDVAIAPDGTIWVVDSHKDRFQIFAADGTFIETWGTSGTGDGEFQFTRVNGDAIGGIAFDADGNIYVADSGNYRIQKFDRDRHFVTTWGEFGPGKGQFVDPFSIATDANGNVYVADDRRDDVQKFTADGSYLATFGAHGYGDGQLNFIGGVAVDGNGNVLVADFGNSRVVLYAADGTFLDTIGEPGSLPGQLAHPSDVALDSSGNIYVTDTDNNRVQVFTSDGAYLAMWGDPGQFAIPTGIEIDDADNVYVTEIDGNRVSKFTVVLPDAPSATPVAG